MNEKEFYEKVLSIVEPWKIAKVELDDENQETHIYLEYPLDVTGKCPECGKESPVHDHREEREWRHLDCGIYKTIMHCRVPRTRCEEHGIKTMEIPWSEKLSHFTKLFERQVIQVLQLAKNRVKTAEYFRLSWDEVNGILSKAVQRGLSRRSEEPVEYLGVDEKSFLRGQRYVQVLTDSVRRRVLEVVENRDKEAVDRAYTCLTEAQLASVKAISMDFWKAYITGAKEHIPKADIVHDKFHLMKYMNEAVDAVRRKEHKALKKKKDDTLTGSKYLWLKNREHFSEKEKERFEELKRVQLAVGRAWNRREMLQEFFRSPDEVSARAYFKAWYFSATHSRLEPVIAVAKMLKRHFEHIITYWKHFITNGFAEGINSVIQHIKATARGFRNFENYRTAILFHCGGLDLFP